MLGNAKLGNIKISSRLRLLVGVQVVLLLVIGAAGIASLNRSGQTIAELNQLVDSGAALSELGDLVQNDVVGPITSVNIGTLEWASATERLAAARDRFEALAADVIARGDLSPASAEGVRTVFADIQRPFETRDRGLLSLFVSNDLGPLIEPFFQETQTRTEDNRMTSVSAFESGQDTNRLFLIGTGLLFAIGAGLSIILGTLVYRSISKPVKQLSDTVGKVSAGDLDARARLDSGDEIGELADAFDNLLDERVANLVRAERENERLNNSIITLLQAVAQLAQRDLTVRVPVAEDVTGPVADALNLLSDETAKVLRGVTRVSDDVAVASRNVKTQSDTVIALADEEREQVLQTSAELAAAADAMTNIAQLAQACNAAAENTINKTQLALETVNGTVTGINATRDTIRETEKRIKRLGERSQEISGAVNLINSIAERTHILALNASMHAASAGEAGRGFAVVADEVQRLAENARRATDQIASLVSNIQTETVDTVAAMNAAISQVVEGSQMAEQAGERMRETQQTTAELVASVRQIAAGSATQAKISNELRDRVRQIEEGSERTRQQLDEQGVQTTNLLRYAGVLVDAVRVFKLPVRAEDRRSDLRVAEG